MPSVRTWDRHASSPGRIDISQPSPVNVAFKSNIMSVPAQRLGYSIAVTLPPTKVTFRPL